MDQWRRIDRRDIKTSLYKCNNKCWWIVGLKMCLFFWHTVCDQFCLEGSTPVKRSDSASYFWSMWLTCDSVISFQLLAEHNKQFDDFWFSFYPFSLDSAWNAVKRGWMKGVMCISIKSGPFLSVQAFVFLCENTPFKALLMLRGTDFYPTQGSQVAQTFVSKSKVKRKCHLVPSAFRISRI